MPLRNFEARCEDIYALCCEAAVDVDLTAADLDGAVVPHSSRSVAPRSRPAGF
jgi:hypothetical protein